ncbi:MAG: OsmC family peroxiredoxin [Flavobacteriales bacterium]
MKRHATAQWSGGGKDGSGTLTTQTKTLSNTAYNWASRFADGTQTNPEELVAAAHAGCFSMKLSFVLGNHGVVPESIETKCTITQGEAGKITNSHLEVKVKASGMDKAKFDECIADAKTNCPISQLLNTEITAEAALIS